MYCIDAISKAEVSCETVGSLIVLTPEELAEAVNTAAAALSPLYLAPDAAVAIGGATLLLMAVAFVFRMARKTLETESEKSE